MYDILCVYYIYVLQGVMGNTSKNGRIDEWKMAKQKSIRHMKSNIP